MARLQNLYYLYYSSARPQVSLRGSAVLRSTIRHIYSENTTEGGENDVPATCFRTPMCWESIGMMEVRGFFRVCYVGAHYNRTLL